MQRPVIASIILAGGKSSRLGQDKASLSISGQPLIQRVIDRLTPISAEIIIVISPRQQNPPFSTNHRVKVVIDIYSNKGSLGGIHSGLVASSCFHNLVVGCDMPFLNPGLLHYLISLSPDYDIVIPRSKKGLEPLHAVYSKNCLGPIEEMIHCGQLKVTALLDRVKVRYVEEAEIHRFDADLASLLNVNTKHDLKQARNRKELTRMLPLEIDVL